MEQNYRPRVGVISPEGTVSPEAQQLYGKEIEFIPANVYVKSLSIHGYEEALKNIPMAVDELKKKNVKAISVMGTSLTFFKGLQFNYELATYISEQTGLPTTTMTTAIIEGLQAVRATRIAVVTAYSKEVTRLLANVLIESGLEPVSLQYLDVPIGQLREVTTDKLVNAAKKAILSKEIDAILISCGGLRTLAATLQLESELDIPVITSPIAGAWATVKLAGHTGYAQNGGRLLSIHTS